MSLFVRCQVPGCEADAELRCSCSESFCLAHLRTHRVRNSSKHQFSTITLPLEAQEACYLKDSSELLNMFRKRLQETLKRRDTKIQELIDQIRQVEKHYNSKIEELCRLFNESKKIISQIIIKSAVPINSTNKLASQVCDLKLKDNFFPFEIKQLLSEHASTLFQKTTNDKWLSQQQEYFIEEHPSDQFIAKTKENGKKKFGNSRMHAELKGHKSHIIHVATSLIHNLIASGGRDRKIKIWEANSGQFLYDLEGHSDWIRSLSFSAVWKVVLSGSDDMTAKIWDLESRSFFLSYNEHSGSVASAAFSPDSATVASGSQDKTIHIWNLADGSTISVLRHHSRIVKTVAFAVDGKYLVSASEDKLIIIWNLETKQIHKTLQEHTDGISSISIYQRTLASVGKDKVIRVWNIDNGDCTRVLRGHTSSISSVDFSDCGRFLVSASNDSIKVWSPKKLVATVSDTSGVVQARFLGNSLVSGSVDGNLKIWNFY